MGVKIYKISACFYVMKLDYASYVLVIVVGFGMAAAVFLKLVWGFNIDSDWLWFLTGLGLSVEGIISLGKQKRFDRKYKIIER